MPKRQVLTTEFKVQRVNWTRYDRLHPRGSGYCSDQGTTQFLVKVWRLFGIKIWSRVIDKEEVPLTVVIEVATLGGTSWKSKFREYMKP